MHLRSLSARHRCCSTAVAASKGFGKASPPQQPTKKPRRRQQKSEFIEQEQQSQPQPLPGQQWQPPAAGHNDVVKRFRQEAKAQQSAEPEADTLFEERLKQLAAQKREQKQDGQQQQQGASAGAGPPADILAAKPYQPFQAQTRPSPAAPSQDEGRSSLSQAGLIAGSILLAVIFIFSSFRSDLQQSTVGSDERPAAAAAQLSDTQRKELQEQAARFDAQLTASPDNIEALEGAAVSWAKLGELPKATQLLVQLSKAKPHDADVFRLLAETQALQGNSAAAAAAYQIANEQSGSSNIDLLSAWTDALIADGKPQKAVEAVQAAQKQADDADVKVDLDLLAGRVYSQWKGHDGEALAIYDRLAESNPEDFRPVLAKGLVLKAEGRKGDAARFFMKARYLAPAASRAAVDSLVSRQQ